MKSRRCQQIGSLIHTELARLLIEEVSDPALREITITEIQMSGDLKHAHIFFSRPPSGPKEKDIERGIERALPFFKRKISDNVALRYIPELHFELDTHGESVARLYSIFDGISHAPEKTE